jgi:hypothetical protein
MPDRSRMIGFRLDAADQATLDAYADEQGLARSAAARHIVVKFLRRWLAHRG